MATATIDATKLAQGLHMSLGDLSDMLRREAAREFDMFARGLAQGYPSTPTLALERGLNLWEAIQVVDAAFEKELDALPDPEE